MFNPATKAIQGTVSDLIVKMFNSRQTYFGAESRFCVENIRKIFEDLDASIRTLGSIQDIKLVSEKFFRLLFGPSPTSLLIAAHEDTVSTIPVAISELPPAKYRYYSKRNGENAKSGIPFGMLEYFFLKFNNLIRDHSGNDFWEEFFLKGLNEIFLYFYDRDVTWTSRFFKDLELSFIYDLPFISKRAGEPDPAPANTSYLRFTVGLLPLYQFYIGSYMKFLKTVFSNDPKAILKDRSFSFAKYFLDSFEVLAVSLANIAINHRTIGFSEIAEIYKNFLIRERGEFEDYFREKSFTLTNQLIISFLMVAKETKLASAEQFFFFEKIICELAVKGRGQHKRLSDSFTLRKPNERSILFEICNETGQPQLWDIAQKTYERVASELGEFKAEELELLKRKMEDFNRKQAEKSLSAAPRDHDVILSQKDWNYPFEVVGESQLLFDLAHYLAVIWDKVSGKHSIPPDSAAKMWKYNNGERMTLYNYMMTGKMTPQTRLRWMAQWKTWLYALILGWVAWKVLVFVLRVLGWLIFGK